MTMGPLTNVAMDAGGAIVTLGVAKAASDMIAPPRQSRSAPSRDASQAPAHTVRLVDTIRPGDRVTIVDRFGQEHTGKAVMKSSVGGWVLNMGGAHGTPGLADDRNIIKVRASPASKAMELNRLQSQQERASGAVVTDGAGERSSRGRSSPIVTTSAPHRVRRGSGVTRRSDR